MAKKSKQKDYHREFMIFLIIAIIVLIVGRAIGWW